MNYDESYEEYLVGRKRARVARRWGIALAAGLLGVCLAAVAVTCASTADPVDPDLMAWERVGRVDIVGAASRVMDRYPDPCALPTGSAQAAIRTVAASWVPDAEAYIAAGLDHPDPQVRATAAVFLQAIDPDWDESPHREAIVSATGRGQ